MRAVLPVRPVVVRARRMIRIQIAGRAYEAPLPDKAVRVGSGADCELRLQTGGIGALQCLIEPLGDGRHVVRDLGSGHPTRVNGLEVHQVSLRPGDVLELGDARIVFEPDPQPAPAAVASPPPQPARAPDTQPPAPRRAAAHHRRLRGPLLAVGVLAAVAVVLSLTVLGGGEATTDAHAERRLEEALDLLRARDYPNASALLETLAADRSAPAVARSADRYLKEVHRAVAEAEAGLSKMWERRLDFDTSSVETARRIFLQAHGESFATRYDEMLQRIRAAQQVWADERRTAVTAEADAHLEHGDFGLARDAWTALGRSAPVGVALEPAVAEGLATVERRAAEASETLLAEAEALAGEHGPAAAVRRLEPALKRYEGTEARARILAALRRHEQAQRTAVLPSPATPATAPEPGTPTSTPVAPSAGAELRARVDEALAGALESSRAMRLAEARDRLAALLPELPAGDIRGEVEGRHEDLALAAAGLEALAADIREQPARYRRLEINPRFFVSLIGADLESVTAAVTGGETRYRWASLSAGRFAAILERMKPSGESALGAAALLRELGAPDVAEKYLFAAGEGGVDAARLFPLLARWRGETPPAGGYVEHDGRYVTPTEKARLVLLARIDDGIRRTRDKDAAVRKAAYDELLSLGEAAHTPLRQALVTRRGAAVEGLLALKVWTSGRTRGKLFEMLEARRADALALIEDGRAWPYPNPTGQNTQEVAARVDRVREVWERPFDAIAGDDADVKEALALVGEVDEVLARIDPSYKPSLGDLKAKVNQLVDMPSYTPTSQASSVREYSLKVLAFNVKVQTTATREERENVLAVNEYRMMMGRPAVKINERLVRAARGHSRHMRTKDYFAHNVPADKGATPQNRDPGARARVQGYGGGVGENIARGTPTGRDAFAAWFSSSGHHRNMINRGWTEMGVGRSGVSWWTQLFGAASGRSLSEPDALPEPSAEVAPEPEDENGRPRPPSRGEVPDEAPPGMPPPQPPPDEEE